MVRLYNALQAEVYDTLNGVEMHVLPQYIAWRANGKYFAEIHLQRNRIMMLSLPPKQEHSIGDPVPENFLWSLNYRSYVGSDADLSDAKEILMDSYSLRSNREV